MNHAKELEMIEKAEGKAKTITNVADKLKLTLATLEEIEGGGLIRVRLDCGNGAELVLDNLINTAAVTKYMKGTLEENAAFLYDQLHRLYDATFEKKKNNAPEKIKAELVKEIPERSRKPFEITAEADTIDEKALERLYFKKGLGVKAISDQMQIPEEIIATRLEQIKTAKQQAAKECARRSSTGTR